MSEDQPLEDILDNMIVAASRVLLEAISTGVNVNGVNCKGLKEIAEYYGIGLHYMRNIRDFQLLGEWRTGPVWNAIRVMHHRDPGGEVK